jgi:methyl-accepting chemotaxis protein
MNTPILSPMFLAIVYLAVTAAVLGVVYYFNRPGATFGLLGILLPTMGIVSYFSIVIGKHGITPFDMCIIFATIVFFITVEYFLIKRILYRNIADRLSKLVSATNEVAAATRNTAQSADEQSAVVAEVIATIREVDKIGDVTTKDAQEVLTSSGDAIKISASGLSRINDAAAVIDAVGEVGNLLETIKALAEQSNLLAVNASIEAAKAGDYGRGFTVVASEMRRLARQSKEVAADIQASISRTEEGRRAIDTIYTVIRELTGLLTAMTEKTRQISSAVIQQSAGIGEVSEGMKSVETSGSSTAAASKQLEQSVIMLKMAGERLHIFLEGSGSAR